MNAWVRVPVATHFFLVGFLSHPCGEDEGCYFKDVFEGLKRMFSMDSSVGTQGKKKCAATGARTHTQQNPECFFNTFRSRNSFPKFIPA